MPTTGWRDNDPKFPDMSKVFAAMERRQKERELKDAVVDAAIHHVEDDDDEYGYEALALAVDALLAARKNHDQTT